MKTKRMTVPVKYIVRPLTPDLWPSFEQLFGKSGACNGCWCIYWLIGPEYNKRPRDKNKSAFRRLVKRGPPPGLLAFDGEAPVGWCLLAPRNSLKWLDSRPSIRRIAGDRVWSIPCFFVHRQYRKRGVTSALIAAAVTAAKRAGGSSLECYPIEADAPGASGNLFTGVASTFARAGFKTIGRRGSRSPIMRRLLRA